MLGLSVLLFVPVGFCSSYVVGNCQCDGTDYWGCFISTCNLAMVFLHQFTVSPAFDITEKQNGRFRHCGFDSLPKT
jgi:hypothetical protein